MDLLTVSQKFVNDRLTPYRNSLNRSAERIVIQYLNMQWLGKSPLILPRYTLDLIVEQYKKMLGEVVNELPRRRRFATPLLPCTSSFRRQYGLPCAHDLFDLYEKGAEVLVDTDNVHTVWHLEQRLVCIFE